MIRYFIVDPDIAAENEMRGDGAMYFCDRQGKLYKVDLIVAGESDMLRYVRQGGQVIGKFKNTNDLIYLGMDTYERPVNGDDLLDIDFQTRSKGYTQSEHNAVMRTYSWFARSSLPFCGACRPHPKPLIHGLGNFLD